MSFYHRKIISAMAGVKKVGGKILLNSCENEYMYKQYTGYF